MPGRGPLDRNYDFFRDYYTKRPGGRDPGDRSEREAAKAYQQLRSEGSFLRTAATIAVVTGGTYLLGRKLPRDAIRTALHHLGQVGKDVIHPFKSSVRRYAGDLLTVLPERRAVSRAAAGVRHDDLQLVNLLDRMLPMAREAGQFPAGARAGGANFAGFAESVSSHISEKYLQSHPSIGRLQYATIGDVLENANLARQIGERQFNVIKESVHRGLATPEMALSPGDFLGLYKNQFGEIVDSRWVGSIGRGLWGAAKSIRIPLTPFRPASLIANVVRPFTRGEEFLELGGGLVIDKGVGIGAAQKGFLLGGTVFEESLRFPGLFEQIARGRKAFDLSKAGLGMAEAKEAQLGVYSLQKVVPKGREGPGARAFFSRVVAAVQRVAGTGPAYRTREWLPESIFAQPLRRRKGKFVPFSAEAGVPGFGWVKTEDIPRGFVERLADQVQGVTQPRATYSRGAKPAPVKDWFARKVLGLEGGWEEARALFGAEQRGAYLSPMGEANLIEKGYLTPQDLQVTKRRFFPKLGRRSVSAESLADLDAWEASLGTLQPYRKIPHIVTKQGVGEAVSLVGHYMTMRLNDMFSMSLGYGFKPSAGKYGWLRNAPKIYAGYLGIRMGAEGADYADYLVEEATGISPWKTTLEAYSYGRTALQGVRQVTGISAAAGYAEELMPGVIESPLSQGVRFGVPVIAGMTRGGGRGLAAGAAVGALLGWGDLSKTPGEIRREHTGEDLIAYRKNRWWVLGRQPFEGSQVDYFGPSWVARQLSDYKYTDVLYGSRKEYFENVSWLPTPTNLFKTLKKPFDVAFTRPDVGYLEKKHYHTRPYPISASGEQTRVQEMMDLSPTSEPDVRPQWAEVLGFEPMDRKPIMAEAPRGAVSDLMDRASELMGIYKFAFWDMPGFQDELAKRGRLASASAMSSHSRSFYDEQLGSMLGMNEMYRRFVMDEKELYKVNKIPNLMPDWMPGMRSSFEADRSYYLDFTLGDPYTKIRHGEARLPGKGYEALHRLHSGELGMYDPMDRFLILADVAPYSHAYRHYKTLVQSWAKAGVLDIYWRDKLGTTLDQVKDKLQIHEFAPRRFTGLSDASPDQIEELNERYTLPERAVGGAWEVLTHEVTPRVATIFPIVGPILGDKMLPQRSPIETYKKWELYGEDFADWRQPWKGFIRPKIHELVATDPATAAAGGAMLGMFGANPLAAAIIGTAGAIGFGAASGTRMVATGQLTGGYIPEHRREERALREYFDHLEYLKNAMLAKRAGRMLAGGGPADLEQIQQFYQEQAGRTVTGLDYSLPYNYFVNQARSAMPRRERAYFDAFLEAQPGTRGEILKVVPDSLKPIYQAAWSKFGDPRFQHAARVTQMSADERASEYFRTAPLPRANWAGWHPSVPMSAVKVKVLDSASSNTALDHHRFNLWKPQAELAYREFPRLNVPRVDIAELSRVSMHRHILQDELTRQAMPIRLENWEGSLSADTVTWDVIQDRTKLAMQYAGSVLG